MLYPDFPQSQSPASLRRFVRLAVVFVLVCGASSAAQTEQPLFDFNGANGNTPQAGLISDNTGAFYGTTTWGGNGGLYSWGGTVYQLSPPNAPGAPWTETVLYSFTYDGGNGNNDGANPLCTLVFDSQGNLYGTTEHGGVHGEGTIFQLVPPAEAGGAWTENVLASVFDTPFAGLVIDASGNLDGIGSGGDVFQLTPPTTLGGAWTYNTIAQVGGYTPRSLIIDAKGNLYGTSVSGGRYSKGEIFGLKPPGVGGGGWTKMALHDFTGAADGGTPMSSLIMHAGVLYGTTQSGGVSNSGTVFSLTAPSLPGQPWTLTTLYNFQGGNDGAQPEGGVIISKSEVLYGTTNAGGSTNLGIVYKLLPPTTQGGQWTETVLHVFTDIGHDGGHPETDLILVKGAYYGTTEDGGINAPGTIFRVTR